MLSAEEATLTARSNVSAGTAAARCHKPSNGTVSNRHTATNLHKVATFVPTCVCSMTSRHKAWALVTRQSQRLAFALRTVFASDACLQ